MINIIKENKKKIITIILIYICMLFLSWLAVKDCNKKIVVEKTYYPNGVQVRELPHDSAKGEANMTYSEYYDDLYFITVEYKNERITYGVDEKVFDKNKVRQEYIGY